MNDSARRRGSVAQEEVESIDFEKGDEVISDIDEERTVRYEGIVGEKSREETPTPHKEQSSHATLAPSKSLQSIHSHRSYAGGDGYTCFNDHEERPNIPSGDTTAETDQQFLVTWEGDSDPMNPRSMNKFRRWVIVGIVSISSLCVTCTSSLYTSTYGQLTHEFHTTRLIATLGLSLFVAGLGIGPMILSPLSEFYGRRPIYIYSYSFFLIWIIPCTFSQNIATMLVARFLDGLAGSAFLSVAGGTVGDLFAKHELSAPMMFYSAAPFIGPEVGPLVGGFINQYTTWRWSFYVLLVWSGVQLALIVIFVPETYHPVLLRQKAIRLRKETGHPKWIAPIEKLSRSIPKTVLWSCIRPFQLLFFEPMCLNLCILSAILLGILYLFFGAFPLVFQSNHGFTISQVGISFMGLLVGMLLGIASDPIWRKNYNRLVQQREAQGGEPGGSEPEFRLPPTIYGAILVPIALFGFGWTTYPWVIPIIFSSIFGVGVIWCFSGVFTFLVDCYPLYAASALAANSFARSSFAAAFPLFGVQMYNRLGYQWATSLLGFLALIMAP
ncbi:benomyl/methotrexate resistance protein [Zopfia rhizophila CBS 207.26]|uniref:Benomyl/methotrexate resistance protein n=1 Tax=Zopfia rhizophila CBS 207.26 TaxID=1314779 RepID=A0A6A6EP85_9PEZI|nr:benomyl/methotrexate resistance protein [Zopfia rhizophila CBS 207.26]